MVSSDATVFHNLSVQTEYVNIVPLGVTNENAVKCIFEFKIKLLASKVYIKVINMSKTKLENWKYMPVYNNRFGKVENNEKKKQNQKL